MGLSPGGQEMSPQPTWNKMTDAGQSVQSQTWDCIIMQVLNGKEYPIPDRSPYLPWVRRCMQ